MALGIDPLPIRFCKPHAATNQGNARPVTGLRQRHHDRRTKTHSSSFSPETSSARMYVRGTLPCSPSAGSHIRLRWQPASSPFSYQLVGFCNISTAPSPHGAVSLISTAVGTGVQVALTLAACCAVLCRAWLDAGWRSTTLPQYVSATQLVTTQCLTPQKHQGAAPLKTPKLRPAGRGSPIAPLPAVRASRGRHHLPGRSDVPARQLRACCAVLYCTGLGPGGDPPLCRSTCQPPDGTTQSVPLRTINW